MRSKQLDIDLLFDHRVIFFPIIVTTIIIQIHFCCHHIKLDKLFDLIFIIQIIINFCIIRPIAFDF